MNHIINKLQQLHENTHKHGSNPNFIEALKATEHFIQHDLETIIEELRGYQEFMGEIETQEGQSELEYEHREVVNI